MSEPENPGGFEKRAVIEPGRTPPEPREKRAGDADKPAPPLESHATRRIAEAAEKELGRKGL